MTGMLLALAPVVPRVAAAAGIPLRTGDAAVTLTFDDGPHDEGTPAILDLLDAARVKATFFLVGEQVERRPALAAEIAARGHVVGLHAYRHRPQPVLRARAVADDLARGAAAIEAATGAALAWHRPPYGLYSVAGLDLVRERGLRPLLWSRWGKDWRRLTTPERIAARRATRALSPGDVILLHDSDAYSAKESWRRTAAALPAILEAIAAQPTGSTSAAAA